MSFAIHQYFNDRGFYYLHTPINTGSDAEGAGAMFRVTTLDAVTPPKKEDGTIDYGQDFFGRETNLTVSGQLEGELGALALGLIYTFGPTFRAENSNTTRHLAEFWMIEPEMAFYELADNMDLVEDMLKYLVRYALDNCKDDLEFLNKMYDNELLQRLQSVVDHQFVRLPYTEAVTTALRPFMAKHGAHVIQPFATLVQHGMLNAGANHTGGVFWPQGQLFTIQSVGKGIHLLLNDVGDFTQAAHKQTRGLHDGGAQVLIGMAAHQIAHNTFQPLPIGRLRGQDIVHALDCRYFVNHLQFFLGFRSSGAVFVLNVFFNDGMKLIGNVVASQSHGLFAVNEHRGCRRFSRARQADANIRMLAFTGAIDDAAHDRHLQMLHARVLLAPDGHLGAQVVINLFGQLLESRAGGATTTRASRDTGYKCAQAQGLQNFRGNDHFLGPGLSGLGGERHPNGVANAFIK